MGNPQDRKTADLPVDAGQLRARIVVTEDLFITHPSAGHDRCSDLTEADAVPPSGPMQHEMIGS